MAAVAERFSQLGFRVIEGGRGGKLAILKSPAIAEIFGVRHDNVLRDIRDFQEKTNSNLRASFAEHCRDATYLGRNNEARPCFELTKVGFGIVGTKYDVDLRILIWLAFDALENDDDAGAETVRRQINQRIRELRSRASGQDELLLDAPPLTIVKTPPRIIEPPIEPDENDDLIDHDEAKARRIWRRGEIAEPAPENALALDRWVVEGWHVRRRNDVKGRAFMIWISRDDALSSLQKNKMLVCNPNGESQVAFCFGESYPSYEIVETVYDTLGPGLYAAIAKATLQHWLS